MRAFPEYLYILVFSLIVLTSYGCDKKQDFEPSFTDRSTGAMIDTDIAKLLSSINMYSFKEPIKAPSFELPSINGENVSLSQFQGKVVLLSFWTTW